MQPDCACVLPVAILAQVRFCLVRCLTFVASVMASPCSPEERWAGEAKKEHEEARNAAKAYAARRGGRIITRWEMEVVMEKAKKAAWKARKAAEAKAGQRIRRTQMRGVVAYFAAAKKAKEARKAAEAEATRLAEETELDRIAFLMGDWY